jgi:hypothetical protein
VAEIRVDIDERAVEDLFSSWSSPVGQAVQQVTDEIEAIAKMEAPVSRDGSKFAWPGYLKVFTRESQEHHFDDQGHVMGLVGAPSYPYNFIANPASRKGYTVNPRSARRPGRVTRRKADDRYLERAVDAAPVIVIGRPELWPARSPRPGSRSRPPGSPTSASRPGTASSA